MKFQLAVNLERMDAKDDMQAVARHTLEMAQIAEAAGFDIVWAAEHHGLEMTIAPNPFQILTWLAGHTSTIRLGTAVVNAAYWHPIRLAGEAAFLDLISGGRLEFGIGSGAYQREFDRMKPGLKQSDSWQYMQEMLPAVQALWAGDYAHDGKFWSFPTATSCPKPLQESPPIWAAARSPITFDYAVRNDCNVMSWPLTRPFSEAEKYAQQFKDALAEHPNVRRPRFSMMRHAAVYDNADDRQAALDALRGVLGQFENLFRNLGDVKNGFPKQIPLTDLQDRDDYNADTLEENLLFGSPDAVIEKLKRYEALGVDDFIYYASYGLDRDRQKRALKMFCDTVMPAM